MRDEQHNTGDNRRASTRISLLSAGLAAAGLAIIALCAIPLIELWNPDYRDVYYLIMILGAGQMAHAWFGSGGMLLIALGHRVTAMSTTIVTGIVTMALCTSGLCLAGTVGLAAGAACGNASQAFMFSRQARRRLGLRTTWSGFRDVFSVGGPRR